MRDGNSVRMVYSKGFKSVSSHVGGSIKEDKSFKIKREELSLAVKDFQSKGGKIKTVTAEGKEWPLPKIKKCKGWRGSSCGNKASGIKGEVNE